MRATDFGIHKLAAVVAFVVLAGIASGFLFAAALDREQIRGWLFAGFWAVWAVTIPFLVRRLHRAAKLAWPFGIGGAVIALAYFLLAVQVDIPVLVQVALLVLALCALLWIGFQTWQLARGARDESA